MSRRSCITCCCILGATRSIRTTCHNMDLVLFRKHHGHPVQRHGLDARSLLFLSFGRGVSPAPVSFFLALPLVVFAFAVKWTWRLAAGRFWFFVFSFVCSFVSVLFSCYSQFPLHPELSVLLFFFFAYTPPLYVAVPLSLPHSFPHPDSQSSL